MSHLGGCATNSKWAKMIEQFENEIGKDLLTGFYDSSYGNDECPTISNEELDIMICINTDPKMGEEISYEDAFQFKYQIVTDIEDIGRGVSHVSNDIGFVKDYIELTRLQFGIKEVGLVPLCEKCNILRQRINKLEEKLFWCKH